MEMVVLYWDAWISLNLSFAQTAQSWETCTAGWPGCVATISVLGGEPFVSGDGDHSEETVHFRKVSSWVKASGLSLGDFLSSPPLVSTSLSKGEEPLVIGCMIVKTSG